MGSSDAAPIQLTGVWYPAGSSRRLPATLIARGSRFQVQIAGNTERSGSLRELDVSKRVGNISRSLRLSDQSLFETADNTGVDRWLGQSSVITGSGLLHQMESRWSWIVISLICTGLIVYAGGRYGLPWTSDKIARVLPDRIVNYVSSGSLDLLDRVFLEPSKLDQGRQQQIRDRFGREFGDDYVLHFRRLGMPNAFALPDGQIVVTDRFAELATAPEFDSVMLHEIGHIELRHGMQQLVQSSIVAFVVAMLVGDPSGLEEVVVGLPVFLMQSHYSRRHESSADDYAFRQMMRRGIDPINFATIMEKMEKVVTPDGKSKDAEGEDAADQDNASKTSFLSSHPATRARIEKAREMSERFNDASPDKSRQ